VGTDARDVGTLRALLLAVGCLGAACSVPPRGDPTAARPWAAARVAAPAGESAVDTLPARHAAAGGDLERARALRDYLVLRGDPMTRARALHAVPLPPDAATARQLAVARLGAADFAAAGTLLHMARRADPAPALDYRLLWQLHWLRRDEYHARAAALLAREHGDPGVLVAHEGRDPDRAALAPPAAVTHPLATEARARRAW